MSKSDEQESQATHFVLGVPWALSIALHAVLIGGFGWLAFRSIHAREVDAAAAQARMIDAATISVELPGVSEGSLLAEQPPDRNGDPPQYFGGTTTARLDTGAPGRGGDVAVTKPAVNLSDRDEAMRLSPSLLSRLDRDQEARIHSAQTRESREDRRSTTNPMELTFLASGVGKRAERRAPSESDPSRGGTTKAFASAQGGLAGAASQRRGDEGSRQYEGAVRDGSRASETGLGVHDARAGLDHRAQAAVTHARPDVSLAAVSVPADVHGRPRDDIDSDQEVATTVRSLVHASTSGGVAGEGRGGSGGGGDPGAGGTFGAGAQGRPLGPGDNEWFDLNTSDPRLVPYFRRIHAKIDPLWANAFPKSALYELKQGTVILEVTIAESGAITVGWPPLRPSGIDEFDRNCYDAVKRGNPFEPIPRELGRTSLKVRMPFDAQNPIVK